MDRKTFQAARPLMRTFFVRYIIAVCFCVGDLNDRGLAHERFVCLIIYILFIFLLLLRRLLLHPRCRPIIAQRVRKSRRVTRRSTGIISPVTPCFWVNSAISKLYARRPNAVSHSESLISARPAFTHTHTHTS